MKIKTIAPALAAAAFVAAAAQAQAAPLEAGQVALSVAAGQDFSLDGDVHGGAVAPVASLAALNTNLPAAGAELRIQSRSFDDIYGEALTVDLEGAYGLGGDRELFVAVRHVQADEGQIQVGTAFVPALSATLPVSGTFGDFQSTSLEAGLRQYFGSGALRPYVAARGGVAFIDEIKASFLVPVPAGVGAEPNDILLTDVPFYDGTTTWVAGVDAGVSYDVNETLSLMAEAGLRFQGELDGDDSAIGGLGLGSINDAGDRMAASFVLKARFAF